MNLVSHAFDDEERYRPTVEGFTKILDRERLKRYWIENSAAIRDLDLISTDKEVVTGNYIAFYRDDLEAVYGVLDRLADSADIAGDQAVGG